MATLTAEEAARPDAAPRPAGRGRPSGTGPRLVDAVALPVGLFLELFILVGGGGPEIRDDTPPPPSWLLPLCLLCLLGLFGALLFRRRWPGPLLFVHLWWALGTALLLVNYNAVVGVLIALHEFSARRRPLWSTAALLACIAVFAYQVMRVPDGSGSGTLLASLALAAASGIVTQQLGRVRLARERAQERAEQEREKAEREREKAEIERGRAELERSKVEFAIAEALRAERLGIARELHDIVAHSVNVMMLQAAGARAVLDADPGRARTALGIVLDTGGQSMKELRRLLGLLRSAAGGDLSADDPPPGLDDLQTLLDRTRAAGLVVDRVIEGAPSDLDPSVSLTGYRVIQEALTNAMKHGRKDAPIRVRLEWTPDRLVITVRSQSTSSATRAHPLSTGNGLRGLRERASIIGGTFDAGPIPDGFRVRCELPVSRPTSLP